MSSHRTVSRRALLAAAPGATLAPGLPADADGDGAHRTIVLVRHAEKGDDDARDPSLSDAGKARALRLATLFSRAGTPRLIASEMKRTQQTLAPLATASGAMIVVVSAMNVDGCIDALRAGDDALTIVASHSNVIPKLAAAFGVVLPGLDEKGNLPETEFGRVILMTVRGSAESAVAVAHVELTV